MIVALTKGLAISLVAMFTIIFFRVAFRWSENVDTKPTNLHMVGKWWRLTWAVLAIGVVPPTLAHWSYIETPQFLEFHTRVALTLAGLVLLNIGACLAETAFHLNRGQHYREAAHVWLIPIAFLTYSMVKV